MGRKRVIGLTGGIGVGKTTAAAILADLGATIVDCDQLGRDVAAVGGAAYPGIVERFGPSVVGSGGDLDRAALASIVFHDPSALADLNAITHPAIDAEIAAAIAGAADAAPVVLDIAVLVETELGASQYERVLVIEAPLAERLQRLVDHREMQRDDALARIASQASDEQRRAVADSVIVNDGDIDHLRTELERWYRAL